MKVMEFRELKKRESTIHYIMEFTAAALMASPKGEMEIDIAFILEMKPLGPPDLTVHVLESVEWPLLPIVHAVREHVLELRKQGKLN